MGMYYFLKPALAAGVAASLLGGTVAAAGQSVVTSPSAFAEPLTVDRGSAAVWQSLQKLRTRASLMMVTAHPDDEDGGMLAYEGRGRGVDTTLLTLNRGEGGQNVMSSDFWDELGLVRTQELLAAGQSYGVHQYWTRVADFGFSKSIDEAIRTWGHDRVLYDCVRVVRMTRPLVVMSVFAGNISDGHGQHQVSGLMAQEVYKAAGDPTVFPDQIKAGLRPWSPLKVYARVPFARVTDKGIFDYATGHWEPVRFRNYVTGTWIEGIPSVTLEVPEGNYNPLFGRSYLAVAREGLGQQKTQNGGVAAPPAQAFNSPYHLYASRVTKDLPAHENDFFDGVDISLEGIAGYAPAGEQALWRGKLKELEGAVAEAVAAFDGTDPAKSAPALAKGLTETNALLAAVTASKLPEDAKYNMRHELETKRGEFNDALGQALGVSLLATAAGETRRGAEGSFQTVVPGQNFGVSVHVANQGSQPIHLVKAQVVSHTDGDWTIAMDSKSTKDGEGELASGGAKNFTAAVTVPSNATLTKPYFSRPNLEQSYYDILDSRYLNLPAMPYPLSATATYSYADVEAEVSGVVQTVHRFTGPGPLYEPLLVAPAIALIVSPEAGIVPINDGPLQVQVTVHSSVKGPAKGEVKLELPAGWSSQPAAAEFATAMDGEEKVLNFQVTPKSVQAKPYSITAVAEYNGQQYRQGFRDVGYVGVAALSVLSGCYVSGDRIGCESGSGAEGRVHHGNRR